MVTTPREELSGQSLAAVESVDAIATAFERKWGIGRLRLVAPLALRDKFDRQCDLFNGALFDNDHAAIVAQAEGTKRGWLALDRWAVENSIPELSTDTWQIKLPKSGKVITLVKDDAHPGEAGGERWSLDEIGLLIEAQGQTRDLKNAFDGAKLVEIRQKGECDGEIPF